ncbi:TetR/AcrR family transcriptional regulator [Thomasclavelia sp.]
MGRRKSEPLCVHREQILVCAEKLFIKKGIKATSMDEIAKESKYSKATLYVYFKNKEEIINILVLKSMKKLFEYIIDALAKQTSIKEKYDCICYGLVKYQEEFPFYFDMVIDKIDINFDNKDYLYEESEIYQIGEKINMVIKSFLDEGINNGEIRFDIKTIPTIISFWAMLSGLIQMASKKEEYIVKELKMSKEEFLDYGFNILYRSISQERAYESK